MLIRILIIAAVLLLSGCSAGAAKGGDKGASSGAVGLAENSAGEDASYDRYFLCSGSRYAYETLSDAEKLWYTDIETILASMAVSGNLSGTGIKKGLDEKNIDHVFQCVMADHPEFFFVEGYAYSTYSRGDKVEKYEFSGTYNVDRETAETKKKSIDGAVDEILQNAGVAVDDYGKIKFVYETVIKRTQYRTDAPDNQNIYSVLVGRASVCQGYAKATQYLLNRLGVECTLITGNVRGGGRHGWNLVKADGDYYYVDTTWGDASYLAQDGQADVMPEINYDYLCVTTAELEKTHMIGEEIELPDCTATRDNYYVRQNAYFDTFDQMHLKEVFAFPDRANADLVSVKCATPECFHELYHHLIEENRIFDYYAENVGSVVYVQNEDQYSLTFWVTNQ